MSFRLPMYISRFTAPELATWYSRCIPVLSCTCQLAKPVDENGIEFEYAISLLSLNFFGLHRPLGLGSYRYDDHHNAKQSRKGRGLTSH